MAGRIEKTIFISYRRTNLPWALAIFQNLKNEGYDVFFDYLSIPSGDFENIIVENIKARAHFVVILTPSALERCNEPGDWLRREIETAMDEKRNIVPLMFEGFDLGSKSATKALTGKLEKLKKYNGLRMHSEYFFEGMNRLREQYLNVSLDAIAHPTSSATKKITEKHQIEASKAASQEIQIPLLGQIIAGEPIPIPASEPNYSSEETSIRIARVLLPKTVSNPFALEVQGYSMIDAMVSDGDIVVLTPLQSNAKAKNGDLVAVWLPAHNETTLKYFFRETDRYRLQPANSTLKPIYIKKSEPLEIRGKVIMVIRKSDTP